jgi:hypothetical protein
MAGKKPIILVNGTGRAINSHYCYKHGMRAATRAITIAMEGKHKFVQIWDTTKGKEIAYVSRTHNSVTLSVKR